MRFVYPLILMVVIACSSPANAIAATQDITPDIATQRALKSYGLESEILRSYDQLQEESKRTDGRFELLLSGSPAVYVLLDRDYWAVAVWEPKKGKKGASFALNPKDEQSALNITIDKGKASRSGVDRSRDPGFSGYTSREGTLAGSRISWRRCADANHLYSEATVTLMFDDGAEKSTYAVRIDITANTEARREVLENCFASLELRKPETEKKTPDKQPEPAPRADTSAIGNPRSSAE